MDLPAGRHPVERRIAYGHRDRGRSVRHCAVEPENRRYRSQWIDYRRRLPLHELTILPDRRLHLPQQFGRPIRLLLSRVHLIHRLANEPGLGHDRPQPPFVLRHYVGPSMGKCRQLERERRGARLCCGFRARCRGNRSMECERVLRVHRWTPRICRGCARGRFHRRFRV